VPTSRKHETVTKPNCGKREQTRVIDSFGKEGTGREKGGGSDGEGGAMGQHWAICL